MKANLINEISHKMANSADFLKNELLNFTEQQLMSIIAHLEIDCNYYF